MLVLATVVLVDGRSVGCYVGAAEDSGAGSGDADGGVGGGGGDVVLGVLWWCWCYWWVPC